MSEIIQRPTHLGRWDFVRKVGAGTKADLPTERCGNCRWFGKRLNAGKCIDKISRTTSRGFMRGIPVSPKAQGCVWWKVTLRAP